MVGWTYYVDMKDTVKNETNWKAAHCESCGKQNPATHDGYTCCCNELVCHGLGKDSFTGRPQVGHKFGIATDYVHACCWAHANSQFAAQGRTAPADSSRL